MVFIYDSATYRELYIIPSIIESDNELWSVEKQDIKCNGDDI